MFIFYVHYSLTYTLFYVHITFNLFTYFFTHKVFLLHHRMDPHRAVIYKNISLYPGGGRWSGFGAPNEEDPAPGGARPPRPPSGGRCGLGNPTTPGPYGSNRAPGGTPGGMRGLGRREPNAGWPGPRRLPPVPKPPPGRRSSAKPPGPPID